MRLICHIGTPKTAASQIQNSFVANRAWLANHGISYPDLLVPDGNHIALFFACSLVVNDFAREHGLYTAEELRELRECLSAHIKQYVDGLDDTIHTVVMSSEILTGSMQHPDAIARLKKLLSPFFDEITIVVYTRRQDDAVLAMYGEFIQTGISNAPFREFVDLCLSPDGPTPYIFYRKLLAPWVKIWGKDNIIVRRFSPIDFIDGNILADFMGIVQNTWEPDMDGFIPSQDDTLALSAPMLEFLRSLYPHIASTEIGKPDPKHAALSPYLSEMPTTPRPVMGASTARRIMQMFADANDWLRDTFFPELDGPFFPARPDQPENSNLGQITLEEFTELTGRFLTKL